MDIQQMKYYLQIYNDRSLTKASQKLYISQQGLSKVIKNIKQEFGIQLFERSPSRLKPTPNGIIMYEHCKRGFMQTFL